MCIFHKWSKWEEHIVNEYLYPRLPDGTITKPVKSEIVWQKRACKKCGKTQRERTDL